MEQIFARKCSVTGEGMNEGFVFYDGEEYAATQENAEVIAKKLGFKNYKAAYKADAGFWTSWEDDKSDWQYISRNGEIEEAEEDEITAFLDAADLFNTPELIPADVAAVLEKFQTEDESYENLELMQQELKPLGYTFEYYLDAVPFGLKKI